MYVSDMKCDAVCEMHPPTHNTMPAALVDIGVGGVSGAGTISPFSIRVDAATFGLLLAVAAFFFFEICLLPFQCSIQPNGKVHLTSI